MEARLREQDAHLSTIEGGVDRLHEMAKDMRTETHQHNALLGSIDSEVERTAEAIKSETRHAQDVNEASGTFWMYMVILGLVAVMLLEITIGVQ